MKIRTLGLFLFALPFVLSAQHLGDRRVVLQEVTIPNMPGIQSFAWGSTRVSGC
jgi:hypothetical protein